MKNWLYLKNKQAKHAFWYLAIAVFGSVSLIVSPSANLQTQLQEAMLVAKAYQIEEVNVKKDKVEEGSSIEDKKERRLTNAQPGLVAASFGLRLVWNTGEDIAYVSEMGTYEQSFLEHLLVPLGSMAPPLLG